MTQAYDQLRRPIQLGKKIGQGGEAAVYQLDSQPEVIAKIFQPAPRKNYEAKLAWMIDHPPDNPTRELSHPSLAWPEGLLYGNNRRLIGYLMPYIQQAVPVLEVFNPRRRAAVMPAFDQRYLYRAARNLAASVAALHRSGYVIGDLNESNALITSSALVTLIDTDSFQVQEQTNGKLTIHTCPVAKLEYTPPELMGKPFQEITRLPEHDSYALAVLIFQLLMSGSHPFRAQWLGEGDPPSLEVRVSQGLFPYMASPPGPVRPPRGASSLYHLHPNLSSLFRGCFIDGHEKPSARPGPAEWRQALVEAEKALIKCSQNHFYSDHLKSCPVCAVQKPRQAPKRNTSSSHHRTVGVKRKRQPQAAQPSGKVRIPPVNPSQHRVHQPSITAQKLFSRSVNFQSLRWLFPSGLPWMPAGWPAQPPLSRGSQTTVGQQAAPTTGRTGAGVQFPQAINIFNKLPFAQPDWLKTWVWPRVWKGLLYGGSLGALIGAVPGALAGLIMGADGEISTWALFWAFGGAAAGLCRGWKPSYLLGKKIHIYIGWDRLWTIFGGVTGGIIGLLFGLIFWWAILPVFLGLIGGVWLGIRTGHKVWLIGRSHGWERIGAAAGALTLAFLGGVLAHLLSSSFVGASAYQAIIALSEWFSVQQVSPIIVGFTAGLIHSACGGVAAGIFSDLVSRLSGLVN
jgi:serine/threonine protein kinase